MGDVERGLQAAGYQRPSCKTTAPVIRVILPAMNQERREQLVKVVLELAEEAEISLRQ